MTGRAALSRPSRPSTSFQQLRGLDAVRRGSAPPGSADSSGSSRARARCGPTRPPGPVRPRGMARVSARRRVDQRRKRQTLGAELDAVPEQNGEPGAVRLRGELTDQPGLPRPPPRRR